MTRLAQPLLLRVWKMADFRLDRPENPLYIAVFEWEDDNCGSFDGKNWCQKMSF